MSETHIAYWDLSPTVDHVVPVARAGADADHNRITTSMLRNSAKSNWTLEELGWRLHPAGSMATWDGMLRWFAAYVAAHQDALTNPQVRRWYRVVVSAEVQPGI